MQLCYVLLLLPHVAHSVDWWGQGIESDADVALRVGQMNIKRFQAQTELMIAAWQEACKIDKACSQADQSILAQVYAYYTPTLDCRGNVAFLQVAPPSIAHMLTEGYDSSKAGYDLKDVPPKECFAHDTTVMAGGDLDFGVRDVEEEFGIVPGTGGRTIFVAASMTMGWRGAPLKRIKSLYRYEFNDEGLIMDWWGHYDPIFVYDALGGREGQVSCVTAQPAAAASGSVAPFVAGAVVGFVAAAGTFLGASRLGVRVGGRPWAGPMF